MIAGIPNFFGSSLRRHLALITTFVISPTPTAFMGSISLKKIEYAMIAKHSRILLLPSASQFRISSSPVSPYSSFSLLGASVPYAPCTPKIVVATLAVVLTSSGPAPPRTFRAGVMMLDVEVEGTNTNGAMLMRRLNKISEVVI